MTAKAEIRPDAKFNRRHLGLCRGMPVENELRVFNVQPLRGFGLAATLRLISETEPQRPFAWRSTSNVELI